MNLRNLIFAFVLACVCVNAIAIKRRCKRIKKSGAVSLPGCGCQNPLFNILDCGCRGPVIDTSYALPSFDIPCGCQNPVIDIPNYRYVDAIEISALGYLNPLEMSNYGCLTSLSVPSMEYIAPLELPCGCHGPRCGCPVKLPAYPYGPLTPIEVPNCQELRSGYSLGTVIEIPSYPPLIQVNGCGCLGSCGCQTLSCGCPGPVCGCQTQLPCGCSGPVCACQRPMPCGCPGPVCGCQSPLPCGCQAPLCGCQSLPCGCPGPMCGCQGSEASICGCGFPGCQCGGKYLRQITLQPPFL